ncbi:hypothetical protein [Myxococcus phage Mx1]|nr:hypothetical protein [Myxococcus phage Mx1]
MNSKPDTKLTAVVDTAQLYGPNVLAWTPMLGACTVQELEQKWFTVKADKVLLIKRDAVPVMLFIKS